MGTKEKEEEGEPEKNPRARKKNREEETMANMTEKEREVGNNAIWGRLCIPTTMRQRIVREAHNTKAGDTSVQMEHIST